MSNGNIQPPKPNSGTVVTILDPRLVDEMKAVKRDTEAILAAVTQDKPAETSQPRYFPRGYFG